MSDSLDHIREAAAKAGVPGYTRHVFLCTGPSCCTPEAGQAAWDALKHAIKAEHLTAGPNACYRSKVGCLRVCTQGPVAVVYPEGTWYADLTAERVPQFVREHLGANQPIAAWIFASNPLPARE